MNSAKNLVLVALVLAAAGVGALAWKQSRELADLRVAVADTSQRDQLGKRAAAAEARATQLADQLASAQVQLKAARDAKPVVATASAKAPGAEEGPTPASLAKVISSAANMMNRPEMQRMAALNAKAGLDRNYAPLFKQLALAPEKLEQLKKLMVERQTVASDVFAAAAQQGLDPIQNRKELGKLTAEGQARVDGELKALLGDGDFSSYQKYQATLPQRAAVNQLQQSLSYTANPLSDAQADQLIQVLAQNPPPRPTVSAGGSSGTVSTARTMVISSSGGSTDVIAGAPVAGVAMGGGVLSLGGGAGVVTPAGVAAARGVLSGPQVDALQQMQQQQGQMQNIIQTMGDGAAGHMGAGVI
ncbi:MAG: hypothetical protein RLZZ15_1273, partial [Verrucomicrobiota bacterium]